MFPQYPCYTYEKGYCGLGFGRRFGIESENYIFPNFSLFMNVEHRTRARVSSVYFVHNLSIKIMIVDDYKTNEYYEYRRIFNNNYVNCRYVSPQIKMYFSKHTREQIRTKYCRINSILYRHSSSWSSALFVAKINLQKH